MVIVCPLGMGLWDPFPNGQIFIAYKWGLLTNHLHPLGAHPARWEDMAWWPGSLNPFLFWGEGVQPKLTIIFLDKPDMGVEPKIGGFLPPNHPFVHKVFHEKSPSILGVKSPIFWKHPYIFLGNVDYGETNVNVLILKIYTGDQNQKNCRKQIVAPQHIYIIYVNSFF